MERQRGISANRNNNPGWHMAKLCQSGKNKLNENGSCVKVEKTSSMKMENREMENREMENREMENREMQYKRTITTTNLESQLL